MDIQLGAHWGFLLVPYWGHRLGDAMGQRLGEPKSLDAQLGQFEDPSLGPYLGPYLDQM